jgi:DNA-binding CsgD family transcriptional regulator
MIVLYRILLVVAFLYSGSIYAQTSYQISNYSPSELRAGNQNWDITSDGSSRIFVANNYGLLVLDNAGAELYSIPDQTILRSVAWINDRVYSGTFEDFGYWQDDSNGRLVYTSLVPLLEGDPMRNDEIWRIVPHNGEIYFHSFGSIYVYDGSTVKRAEIPGSLMFLHQAGDQIVTQQIGGPAFNLVQGVFEQIPGTEALFDEEVKDVVALPDGQLILGTSAGIYEYSTGRLFKWPAQNYDELIASKINAMVSVGNQLIVGTILRGIFVYDQYGSLIKNITTINNLQNNTILSLYADPEGNLWVGMDKGIDYIDLYSPIVTYRDPTAALGSVYTAAMHDGLLYVGTNQGIFKFRKDQSRTFIDQQLVSDSQGQVWFLQVIDNRLYAGLNDGTYVLENDRLVKIGTIDGGYTLKPWPTVPDPTLIQSTYNDLVVFKRRPDGVWQQDYLVQDSYMPARYLEIDHVGNIWLGHAVKGIYRLQPDRSFRKITSITRVDSTMGVTAGGNRVFKLDNRIIIPHGEGLLQYDAITNQFKPFTDLEGHFTTSGIISSIVPAGERTYWVIKKSEVILIEVYFDVVSILYRLLPQQYGFSMIEGYENIVYIGDDMYLAGLDDGFATVDMAQVRRDSTAGSNVMLSFVKVTGPNDRSVSLATHTPEPIRLPNQQNTLTFTWNTDQLVGNRLFVQFQLVGSDSAWSQWQSATQVMYPRLLPGAYEFKLRAITTGGELLELPPYAFIIKEPWYLTTFAFVFYFVIAVALLLTVRIYVSRRRWRALGKELEARHEKMLMDKEISEKEIIKLTNEKLQAEVEHKSAQLATNTMAVVRKNELLQSIKSELQKQKTELGDRLPRKHYNQLITMIDRGLQDEKEWEDFEQLYDQAHGDFFKRLKAEYPQLTPSDLRLCAYLRMNLSSKEIAPLLSISVRGVEERRYRLRKRLNLSTDTNLTEVIMTY